MPYVTCSLNKIDELGRSSDGKINQDYCCSMLSMGIWQTNKNMSKMKSKQITMKIPKTLIILCRLTLKLQKKIFSKSKNQEISSFFNVSFK